MENKEKAIDNTLETAELINNQTDNLEENSSKRDFEAELNDLQNQLLRTLADTENMRKRYEKQVEDASKYAVTNFAKDLINVMENLCRTTDLISNNAEGGEILNTIIDGVEMTKRELTSVFSKYGIQRIAPIVGDSFDHNLHQAVANVEMEGAESGAIVQVLQAGYMIQDRLINAAMVGVAK